MDRVGPAINECGFLLADEIKSQEIGCHVTIANYSL